VIHADGDNHSDQPAPLGDVCPVTAESGKNIVLACWPVFDMTRVFLFDAFVVSGAAISATYIRLDVRGNGDVP
jgi:hypothetical protein